MTPMLEQRKAALAMSILSPASRERLLESLPGRQQNTTRLLLAEIFAKGWNDSAAVELVLGIKGPNPSEITINTQNLVKLSQAMGPELYARVLVAADISERGFLVSLLERGYAAQVHKALSEVPILPDRLKKSLLSSAQAHLTDAKVQTCAV